MPDKIIYTAGLSHGMSVDCLRGIIERCGIDMVVDIRDSVAASLPDVFEAKKLQCFLSGENVEYISMGDVFGTFPVTALNKRGAVVYHKAIATESIMSGLNALKREMEGGRRLLLVDDEEDTAHSVRFTVIGRFLAQSGCRVLHCQRYGIENTQQELEVHQIMLAEERRAKRLQTSALGKWGEEMATQYLMEHGFIILDRNWDLHQDGELDIVAWRDGVVHFVEVKTREPGTFLPQAAIDKYKLANLHRAISAYRGYKGMHNTPYQLDSIAIVRRTDCDYDLEFYEKIDGF